MSIKETISTFRSDCSHVLDETRSSLKKISTELRPHRRLFSGLVATAVLAVGATEIYQPLKNVLDSELKTAQNSIYAKLPALTDSGPAGTEAAAAVDKFCIEVGCAGKDKERNSSNLEHRGTKWVHRDENIQALNIETTRDTVDRIVRTNNFWTYFAHPERAAALYELDRNLPHVSQAVGMTGPR